MNTCLHCIQKQTSFILEIRGQINNKILIQLHVSKTLEIERPETA